jgi:hypothetical protein
MYQTCPKMYAARYQGGDKGINVWGIIGSSAHKAIEGWYRDKTDIPMTFIGTVGKTITKDTEGFEYAQRVSETIYNHLTLFDPKQFQPTEIDGKLSLERYFKLPYPNKDNPICYVNGYIDMLTHDGFIDWKTGSEQMSKKKVENDLQFILYAWVFEQLTGRKPLYGLYYKIRGNKQYKGMHFDIQKVDTVLRQLLSDPFTYDEEPCKECPIYCGVRRALH